MWVSPVSAVGHDLGCTRRRFFHDAVYRRGGPAFIIANIHNLTAYFADVIFISDIETGLSPFELNRPALFDTRGMGKQVGSMGNQLGKRGNFLANDCIRLSVAASASAASGRGRRFRRLEGDRVVA